MPAAPPEAHQAGAPPTAALQLRATVPAGWSRTCIRIMRGCAWEHCPSSSSERSKLHRCPAERSREQSEQSLPTPVHATQVALGGLAGQLR